MQTIEATIIDQLHQLRVHRQSINKEQTWMRNHLADPKLRSILPKISIVGLHLLTALLPANQTGAELAEKVGVTPGGITRAAKKLLALSLIDSFHQAPDKKKIYYRLTPAGKQIAVTHQQMHEQINQQFAQRIGQKYDQAELHRFAEFLTDLQELEDELLK